MRSVEGLNDLDIVSYFNSYMKTGLGGRRKEYETTVKELEKAGKVKEANRYRKIAQKYRELEGLLRSYQDVARLIVASSRNNTQITPEELERRLELFKRGLKLSKEISHFKINTGSFARRGIDSICAPNNNVISVRFDDPTSGYAWWPGMKQMLAIMNGRIKNKVDSLNVSKGNSPKNNSSTRAQKAEEERLFKAMNDLKLSTMLDIVGIATIAQNDPDGIHRRVESYQKAYEDFCKELEKRGISRNTAMFAPESLIYGVNNSIAEEMLQNKERYAQPNLPSKDGHGVVYGMVTATCLMEPEQVGLIYRNMVIAYEREGVYKNETLQTNFVLTVYHMMKNSGELDKDQKLTPEIANRICSEVLKAAPIYTEQSSIQQRVTTRK